MSSGITCPLGAPHLYETEALRQATGETLRPGGLTLLQEAMKLLHWPAGSRVADIGCGIGSTAAYLREKHGLQTFGIDLSARLLGEAASRHVDLPLVRGRAENLPFADGSLAGLTCECVLSLTRDPDRTLQEFQRVLAPGGTMVLSDLYRRKNADAGSVPKNCCLSGAVSRERLFNWLHEAKLEIKVWQDRSHLLAELAARLVLLHGSLESFWEQFAPNSEGHSLHQAVQAIRPGYFLLIARKF
ncbi:MAG: class I SAM-dependent methyltransferase [Syntrophotaleaceae bacterium]